MLRRIALGGLAAGWALAVCLAVAASAQSPGPQGSFARGDVIVALASGQVEWHAPDGALRAVLSTVGSGQTTGAAFDGAGNLYVTEFEASSVSKFDSRGRLVGRFGRGYDAQPESIVFDAAGNVFVGQAGGAADILKFSPSGKLLDSFDADTESRGTDWIDLASDQCTVFYTSEGTSILRYDVCADEQLDPLRTDLSGSAAYALRLLPDGGLLVADNEQILRLDPSGAVTQTYDAPGRDQWFALNLDPDGTSFWSAGLDGPTVYKFDLGSGDVLLQFDAQSNAEVGGLAVLGEITAARPRSPAFTSSLRSPGDLSHNVAHILINVAVAAGIVLLMPFPAELFNSTLEEHYDEVMGWFRRPRSALARARKEAVSGRSRLIPYAAVTLLAALLYAFLDPTFGLKLDSLAVYLGLVAGLIVVTAAFGSFELAYMRLAHRERAWFRSYPGTLPVAALCVAVSRIIKFQPGYMYGTVAGVEFGRELSEREEGRRAAFAGVGILLLSVAAWVVRIPIHRSVEGGSGFAFILLDAALVTVFVAGIEGLVFGLLPFRFLDGSKVRAWNPRLWTLLFGIGVLGLVYVLLNPVSGYLSRAPAVTTIALFVGFGLASVAFWAYFRYRRPRVSPEVEVPPAPPPPV